MWHYWACLNSQKWVTSSVVWIPWYSRRVPALHFVFVISMCFPCTIVSTGYLWQHFASLVPVTCLNLPSSIMLNYFFYMIFFLYTVYYDFILSFCCIHVYSFILHSISCLCFYLSAMLILSRCQPLAQNIIWKTSFLKCLVNVNIGSSSTTCCKKHHQMLHGNQTKPALK